jgi:hypothetical protein
MVACVWGPPSFSEPLAQALSAGLPGLEKSSSRRVALFLLYQIYWRNT